jgi:hypothetical protein
LPEIAEPPFAAPPEGLTMRLFGMGRITISIHAESGASIAPREPFHRRLP